MTRHECGQRFITAALVIGLWMVLPSAGQTQADSSPTAPPRLEESKPRLATPGRIVIPKGMPISLRLAEYLDPKIAQVGQPLRLVAAANIRLDRTIIVARGALAEGHVEYIKPARRLSRSAEVGIRVDWVECAGGERIPLQALKRAKGPKPGEVANSRGQKPGAQSTTPPTPGNAGPALASQALTALVLIFSKGQDQPVEPGLRLRAAVEDDVELEMAPLIEAQTHFPDPGGTATLHFLRPNDGQPFRPTIYCQGKKIVRLASGHHFSIQVPAGTYECRTNDQPPVTFELLGGEEYFLRPKIRIFPDGKDPGKLKWALGVKVYWDLAMAEVTEAEDAMPLTKEQDKKNVYPFGALQPLSASQK